MTLSFNSPGPSGTCPLVFKTNIPLHLIKFCLYVCGYKVLEHE